MTYVTTKCPHCGEYIKVFSNQKTSHGCPFKTCSNCGNIYVDKNCYEQALYPYKKSSKSSYTASALFVAFAIAIMPFVAIAYFSDLNFTLAGAISGVIFLLSFIYFYRSGHSNYEANEARILKEWQESDKRLKNPEYADALVKAGFNVPETYLNR